MIKTYIIAIGVLLFYVLIVYKIFGGNISWFYVFLYLWGPTAFFTIIEILKIIIVTVIAYVKELYKINK